MPNVKCHRLVCLVFFHNGLKDKLGLLIGKWAGFWQLITPMLEVNQSSYKTSSEGTSAEMEEALLPKILGHYVFGYLKYKKFGLIYVPGSLSFSLNTIKQISCEVLISAAWLECCKLIHFHNTKTCNGKTAVLVYWSRKRNKPPFVLRSQLNMNPFVKLSLSVCIYLFLCRTQFSFSITAFTVC